jgi:hypothetical protein
MVCRWLRRKKCPKYGDILGASAGCAAALQRRYAMAAFELARVGARLAVRSSTTVTWVGCWLAYGSQLTAVAARPVTVVWGPTTTVATPQTAQRTCAVSPYYDFSRFLNSGSSCLIQAVSIPQ